MNYAALKAGLDNCTNPVYLFDDDPDGVCAFLTLYRYKQEGNGMILKTSPHITIDFVERIAKYSPDALFILDIAHVDQEFIDAIKIPVFWVDHHEPQEIDNVLYINPKPKKNMCTTELCSNAVGGLDWLTAAGIVSDWMLPEYRDEDLLPTSTTSAPEALFDTKIGTIVQVISFVLKGSHHDAMKHVKVLTRITNPQELLHPTTAQSKYLWKRYMKVKKRYDHHWKELLQYAKEPLIIYTYGEKKLSFSSDLSNRALYEFNKVCIIGRENDTHITCSVRSPDIPILPVIKQAVNELQAVGGGHDMACGINIRREDFPRFVEMMKEYLSEGGK